MQYLQTELKEIFAHLLQLPGYKNKLTLVFLTGFGEKIRRKRTSLAHTLRTVWKLWTYWISVGTPYPKWDAP